MEDIKLRKVDDPTPEKNTLPRGVHAVVVGERVFFVRRVGGRFVPLPDWEQDILRDKHVS